MDENNIKSACIDYLRRTGWLVLRINSGAVSGEYTDNKGRKRKRFFSFVRWFVLGYEPDSAGVSDIIALKPGCMPLAVETKAPGKIGNTSAAQERFLAIWQQHGGQAVVCDSVDILIEAINE